MTLFFELGWNPDDFSPITNNFFNELFLAILLLLPAIIECIIALEIGFNFCRKKSKKFILVGSGLFIVDSITLIVDYAVLFNYNSYTSSKLYESIVGWFKAYPIDILDFFYPVFIYFLLTVPVYLIFTEKIKLNKHKETETETESETKTV